ncbi:hypothetical protein ROZALSC1DRAFT_27457 [Rozella allomycis CSF55]|uniref:ABC transmembrane type-1 domain-containing protein n=1 Tax=Rozella allomycis (strain CSF55) TaxID=988480 RepID=A0A4P9YNL5_ROZAC|nr:hypothetical protein ROZALSC1DRAFT_27457 [Rozella allomycis CSF55]
MISFKILSSDHRMTTDVDLLVKNMTYFGPLLIYSYFLIGTLISNILVPKIANIVNEKEKFEGNYSCLVKDEYENICFYRGEDAERAKLSSLFTSAVALQKKLVGFESLLEGQTKFMTYFGSILSYLILGYSFMSNDYDHLSPSEKGALLSKNSFFAMYLINSLTKLLELANEYSNFLGYKNRVESLINYEDELNVASNIENEFLMTPLISFQNCTLKDPSGHVLISNLYLDINKNESVLINGVGKTSIARAMADIWTLDAGKIKINDSYSYERPFILFCPDASFLMNHPITDILTYPDPINQVSLNILDESTTCIDRNVRDLMYEELTKSDITFITISHDPSLLKYHKKLLIVQDKQAKEVKIE